MPNDKIPKAPSKSEKNKILNPWFCSDRDFDRLYPSSIQELGGEHWTPLAIARKAVQFLVCENGVRILDVGSGVGKFCLAAAYYRPSALYTGIEQRKNLVLCAEDARRKLQLKNINFIHGNFTMLDLRYYDHFYFYNAFYENLIGTEKIDYSIAYSNELYYYYTQYLRWQLQRLPRGTRLTTFHSTEDEIPSSYHLAGSEIQGLLKFWIKTKS
jgi:SAM-dependent methyltransferase